MTLTPSGALALSTEDITLIASVKDLIDSELSLNLSEGKAVEIRHAVIFEAYAANPRVIETIKNDYVAAGWKIAEYTNDKQGPWLSFSKA